MLGGAESVSLAEAGLADDCAEEGATLLEIAENKAAYYSKKFDGPVIATDGGAAIPALKGWDARFTKRFGGEGLDDFQRMDLLLEKATRLKGKEREFCWIECAAIAEKGKIIFSACAKGDEGSLQTAYDAKKYKKGIWLCSLWFYPELKKNFFDLTPVEREKKAESSWKKLDAEIKRFLA